MENLFTPILDDDEIIEKIYKPQKAKLFLSTLFGSILTLLIFCGGLAFALLVPDEDGFSLEPIYALIPAGIFVLCIAVIYLFTNWHYKKTAYAVTNKRIVIRTGIIGVDFKTLDMGMIGAIDVYVSVLDKILCKNTGTVRFGSTSSPMASENANRYTFRHIVMPYETCKAIKARIDEYKNK